jgi:transcriptional antiterminator RfaH
MANTFSTSSRISRSPAISTTEFQSATLPTQTNMAESADIGRSWYLVYTKPRQEKVAAENLLRQKYEVYFPQLSIWRTRRGKRQSVIEPLFPRYLFIRLDSQSDNWAPIRSTLGVMSLVRFGTEPARVPDELVEYLRSRHNADGLHEWAQPKLIVGERARVVSGPLAGYEGILIAKSSRDRVVILMDLVGGQVRAKLNPDQIEPAAR